MSEHKEASFKSNINKEKDGATEDPEQRTSNKSKKSGLKELPISWFETRMRREDQVQVVKHKALRGTRQVEIRAADRQTVPRADSGRHEKSAR